MRLIFRESKEGGGGGGGGMIGTLHTKVWHRPTCPTLLLVTIGVVHEVSAFDGIVDDYRCPEENKY